MWLCCWRVLKQFIRDKKAQESGPGFSWIVWMIIGLIGLIVLLFFITKAGKYTASEISGLK